MSPARRNALLPTRAATSAALSTGTQDGGRLPIHAVTKRAIVAGLAGRSISTPMKNGTFAMEFTFD